MASNPNTDPIEKSITTEQHINEPNISLFKGDCLDVMNQITNKSIDLILCDLPYGVTKNKWDVVIPFDKLWEHYNRIIKDNGAIVLFGSQPFTTMLISSNMKYFVTPALFNTQLIFSYELFQARANLSC